MKLFFDGSKIIELNEQSRTLIIQIGEGKDWKQFSKMLWGMINKGNPDVDVTLYWQYIIQKQIECQKCNTINAYAVTTPNPKDYGDLAIQENRKKFNDDHLASMDPGILPIGIVCHQCGEPID